MTARHGYTMQSRPELAQVLEALGVMSALSDIADDLEQRAERADLAWQTWLDAPAFLRKGALPDAERQLHAQHVRASAAWERFARNPYADVTLQLSIVPAAEFAERTSIPTIVVLDRSGSHVAVLKLEVAEA